MMGSTQTALPRDLTGETGTACTLVRNEQSTDLVLYAAHDMAKNRRAVIVLHVSHMDAQKAIKYYCAASAFNVHNILFAVTDAKTQSLLRWHGLRSVVLPTEGNGLIETHPIVRLVAFIAKALYDGYNILLADLNAVVARPLDDIVGDADIQFSTGKYNMVYFKSRGRTFGFCKLLGDAIKRDLQAVYVAPYSWRERKILFAAIRTIRANDMGKSAPEFDHFADHMFVQAPKGVDAPTLLTPGVQWVPPQIPTFCAATVRALQKTVASIAANRTHGGIVVLS
eukprot:m.598255 g.598255  ORF g.598255 m.598255 type:complete len:282 (+) comp22421_c0_seq3:1891-2736(+)